MIFGFIVFSCFFLVNYKGTSVALLFERPLLLSLLLLLLLLSLLLLSRSPVSHLLDKLHDSCGICVSAVEIYQ